MIGRLAQQDRPDDRVLLDLAPALDAARRPPASAGRWAADGLIGRVHGPHGRAYIDRGPLAALVERRAKHGHDARLVRSARAAAREHQPDPFLFPHVIKHFRGVVARPFRGYMFLQPLSGEARLTFSTTRERHGYTNKGRENHGREGREGRQRRPQRTPTCSGSSRTRSCGTTFGRRSSTRGRRTSACRTARARQRP